MTNGLSHNYNSIDGFNMYKTVYYIEPLHSYYFFVTTKPCPNYMLIDRLSIFKNRKIDRIRYNNKSKI